MISIKKNIQNLIHKAIISAFPVSDFPNVKVINSRDEIFQFDYICDSPKLIFDKYKIKNSFFGLTSYKEIADDIKIQVPRNSIISKIETTQGGSLKIKIDDNYLKELLPDFKQLPAASKQKKAVICMPGIDQEDILEYDYFRGINVAEKLDRTLKMMNYNSNLIFPFIDRDPSLKNQSISYLDNIFRNSYFDFNPEIFMLSDLMAYYNEKFYAMNKEFWNFKKKGESNLSMISLLLYRMKTMAFNDAIIFISSQNQEVFLKNSIQNFLTKNQNKNRSFENIYEFYFGGLLLEGGNTFKTLKIESELNSPSANPFNFFEVYFERIDPALLEKVRAAEYNTGLEFKNIEILKALDISRISKSTQSISVDKIEEFINKFLIIFVGSYQQIKKYRERHDENIQYTEFDDTGRVLALKLLRLNESLDDVLNEGELEKMFNYWEDLAKIWYNLFNSNMFASLNNKGLLLGNSLAVYEKFFYIFFGCKKL